MFTKRFDDINKADIDLLIADQVPEGRALDYKAELPGKSDGQRKEFAADVTSFANAAGGYIVFGVTEAKDAAGKNTGTPDKATGLASTNGDEAVLRLESMARTNLDPPIPGLRTKALDGFPDGPVVVMHIPKSWAAPHMVAVSTDSRFYSRGSAGKQPLTVTEIRSAFQLSSEMPNRIRRFRDERLGRVIAGETPVPLHERGKLIVHLLPLASLNADAPPVDLAAWSGSPAPLQPLACGGGWNHRFNFDGFVTFSGPQEGPQRSYLQVLRMGALEAVTTLREPHSNGITYMNPWGIEEEVCPGLSRFVKLAETHDLPLPMVAMTSLLGVKGSALPPSWSRDVSDGDHRIERDDLLLPDVLLDRYDADLPALLRPSFDALWQAIGMPRSLCYDEQGAWNARGFRWS